MLLFVAAILWLCRSPHGERGLKSGQRLVDFFASQSLPTRGAWIEIAMGWGLADQTYESLPTRGAWIEI